VLQAEVVKYKSQAGEKLEREWFVQAVEALANVLVGLVGMFALQGGPSPNIPYLSFAISGTTQVPTQCRRRRPFAALLPAPSATFAAS
jgi:hypothetical protein